MFEISSFVDETHSESDQENSSEDELDEEFSY